MSPLVWGPCPSLCETSWLSTWSRPCLCLGPCPHWVAPCSSASSCLAVPLPTPLPSGSSPDSSSSCGSPEGPPGPCLPLDTSLRCPPGPCHYHIMTPLPCLSPSPLPVPVSPHTPWHPPLCLSRAVSPDPASGRACHPVPAVCASSTRPIRHEVLPAPPPGCLLDLGHSSRPPRPRLP